MEHALPESLGKSAHGAELYRDETLEQFRQAADACGLRVNPVAGWQGVGAREGEPFAWTAEAFGAAFSSATTSEIYLVELVSILVAASVELLLTTHAVPARQAAAELRAAAPDVCSIRTEGAARVLCDCPLHALPACPRSRCPSASTPSSADGRLTTPRRCPTSKHWSPATNALRSGSVAASSISHRPTMA